MKAPMSMSRKICYSQFALDILIFSMTIGVLAYLSEKHNWSNFTAIAAISVVLYALLRLLESKATLDRLRQLEAREFSAALKMDAFGLRAIFDMRNNKEMHLRNVANIEIIQKGNRFSLLGESASSYIDPSVRRHWDALKGKLDQGTPLKLLLVNPFCPTKQLRNELNAVASGVDPKLKLDIVRNLYCKYTNVDVRFTDDVYCSVFFSENEMMYDPYHLGKVADRLENYFMAFHFVSDPSLRKGEFDCFAVLKSHFDVLWDRAMDFNDFLVRYGAELQQTSLSGVTRLERSQRTFR